MHTQLIQEQRSQLSAILVVHGLKHTIHLQSMLVLHSQLETVIIKMTSIQICSLHNVFSTYSAASGSLNANHKCEVSQQQRDGQIQVNKHVDSM